ncbi:hypothetical protein [Kitasatospora camelliae]|uniref:Uncharacterized protein n=1 Tax=Kitasatospora camelliae TaxID=3156397 RepID=A0AAU8JUG5_9ACTN
MPETERMARMAALVHTALGRATAGLLEAEATQAADLTAADRALHELLDEIEDSAAAAPTRDPATPADLRRLVADAHLGDDFEGLAVLIRHIAGIAWARHDSGPLPARLRLPLRTIAGTALGTVAAAGEALATATPTQLTEDLDEIGLRQRLLHRELLTGDGPPSVADATESTLLACHLRQCAERAASLAGNAGLLTGA